MRRFLTVPSTVALLAALAALAAGCGGASSGGSTSGGSSTAGAVDPNAAEVSPAGDIPDNQAFVRYAPPGAGFSVEVPEGWSRSGGGGAPVVFTDKLNAISLQSARAPIALTAAAARQADVPKLARTVPGFRPGTVTAVPRSAGTAVRITYLADARANAVTGKAGTDAVERYLFFHNGNEAILTLSGPKGADNVDPWKIVTDSLRWSR